MASANPQRTLEGKLAIVTGGARGMPMTHVNISYSNRRLTGIGRAIARAPASRGRNLILTSISNSPAIAATTLCGTLNNNYKIITTPYKAGIADLPPPQA